MKKILPLALLLSFGAAVLLSVSCATEDAAKDIAGGMAIAGFMSIWICVAAVSALIGLFFFVIWIIALVDCARRKLDEFPAGGENSKTIWLVILIVTFFVGNLNGIAAIVYYFMVMKKMPQKKLKKMPRKK